jgi:uncharacterized protein (TIGR00725 family)
MAGHPRRKKIVGVMGSGQSAHPDLARPVGRIVAALGCHLLTGGGRGVMEEVSRAFVETTPRDGLCLGIVRGEVRSGVPFDAYLSGEVNDFVEVPISTHLPLSGRRGTEPLSRNHINVLTADVLVALPGGAGTRSEIELRQRYGRPVILFLGDQTVDGSTPDDLRARSRDPHLVHVARSPDELELFVRRGLDAVGHEAPAAALDSQEISPVSPEPATHPTTNVVDFLDRPYEPPDLEGERVLVVGIGGGSDIISAYAFSRLLVDRHPAALLYANTKRDIDRGLTRISKHVYRVPEAVQPVARDDPKHGTTKIDRSVPRGDEGCPVIFLLPEEDRRAPDLAAEIDRLRFDHIFAVDTGGDSLLTDRVHKHAGRGRRMLAVLERCVIRLHIVVLGPGCDGEASFLELHRTFTRKVSNGRYLGCFSLAPMIGVYRQLAALLSSRRTPNILTSVHDGSVARGSTPGTVIVPRGQRPLIPEAWLKHGFVFDLSTTR